MKCEKCNREMSTLEEVFNKYKGDSGLQLWNNFGQDSFPVYSSKNGGLTPRIIFYIYDPRSKRFLESYLTEDIAGDVQKAIAKFAELSCCAQVDGSGMGLPESYTGAAKLCVDGVAGVVS